MKILTIVSGLDFINYTRRASIESIHKLNPDLEVLLFNSIRNIFRITKISSRIKFRYFYFWIPERLRFIKFLSWSEYIIRALWWRKVFISYEIIFIIDPNQYYLLPYLNRKHKVIYLLRDPSILLYKGNYEKELKILNRANAVLAVSGSLCDYYFIKYYGTVPEKVFLWPNTIDLDLWKYDRWSYKIQKKSSPVAGLAGNIDFVIDIELLNYITEALPQISFEIAGKVDFQSISIGEWDTLLSRKNVKYLGFIPFDEFPGIVINWDIGLVAAKPYHEYARYLNNNKQYQYVALGKPFVTYELGSNYKDFYEMVFIAESREDYVNKINQAIDKSKEEGLKELGFKIAIEQSSEKRAESFLNYLKEL